LKAILLAAGFGTRLRPLTDNTPKCLVPIKGKPLLEIWLEKLENAGLNYFLINTHYLSKQVDNYIEGSKFQKKCVVKYEEVLLGTAGTVLNNFEFIGDEDCMLIHADNYCQDNLKNFIIAHNQRPKHCLMTMMTFRTDNPKTCGIVEIDEDNVVIGFHEKVNNPPGDLANGAVYIISQDLIKLLKENFFNVSDFSIEVLNNILGKIYSYETKDIFIDIGNPKSYLLANTI